MNVAFWDNQLCERGTTVALYDYAFYNQTILNNKSFIFYDKNSPANKDSVIQKFNEHFTVHGLDSFSEVDDFVEKYKITHFYNIKYGTVDNKLSKIAKNCIHCVFDCTQPHGDVYSSVSSSVYGNNGRHPVVPHMINLPDCDENMRDELKIPKGATVFGGYGGKDSFSIGFVHSVVYDIAKNNPNIYFLFANFNKFCPDLPNIIHIPMITDLKQKVKFINTADAMIWAQHLGETFGLAIGEFSTKNKPVIATKVGTLAFADILKDKAFWYHDSLSLYTILLTFDRNAEKNKDWNAYTDYTPEKVMDIFKNTYLS
jgi:hypothetical protein